ncbi:MAG: tetratricopeptide repeat protein [Candidatus Mariimomonas ferrooxydans]
MERVGEQVQPGRVKDAIDHLEKLVETDKDNIKVRTRLKDFYIEAGERDKAVGECLALAEFYEKNGDFEARNTMIAEATDLNPDDPRLITVGMPSDEIEVEEASSEKTDVPPSGKPDETFEEELAEAKFYAQQGLVDEAIGIFEKLLPLSPDKEEIMKKLRELKPEWMPEEELAEKTEEHAKIDEDLKDVFHEFKKGIEEELGEQDCETRYNLGIAYKEMGLLDDAIREFKIAAKDLKKTARSLSMLALCYMDKKLYPLAIQEYKRLMESVSLADEGYLETKCDLADAYVKNEDYAKAVKFYIEIYSQSPKFRDVARKVEIVKKLELEAKSKPKAKKDRVSYI